MEEERQSRLRSMMGGFRRSSRSVSSSRSRKKKHNQSLKSQQVNLLSPRQTDDDDDDEDNIVNNANMSHTINDNAIYNDIPLTVQMSPQGQQQQKQQQKQRRRSKSSRPAVMTSSSTTTRSDQLLSKSKEPVPRSLSPSMARNNHNRTVHRNESLSDYWARKEREAHQNIARHRDLYMNDSSNNSSSINSTTDRHPAPASSTTRRRHSRSLSNSSSRSHQRSINLGISNTNNSHLHQYNDDEHDFDPVMMETDERMMIINNNVGNRRSSSKGMQAASLARATATEGKPPPQVILSSDSDDYDENNLSPLVSDFEDELEDDADSLPIIGNNNKLQTSKMEVDEMFTDYRDRHINDTISPQSSYEYNNNNSYKNNDSVRMSPFQQSPATDSTPTINLHRVMEHCAWATLYSHLKLLAENKEMFMPCMLQKQSTRGDASTVTVLHTMVWKAPPTCTLTALKILEKCHNSKINGNDFNPYNILSMRDSDGNTPLHLCCANLEFHEQDEADEEIDTTYLNVLQKLVNMSPRNLLMSNREGDSPLHLFLASPAVCMKTEHTDVPLQEKRKIALQCLLKEKDSCFIRDKTGATPLHVAIAHAIDDALIQRMLRINGGYQLLQIEDERGMIPLHYVAAFAHTSFSTVSKMIDLYPDSLYHKTHNRDTPLHLLVSNACQKTSKISSSTAFNGKLDRNTIKVVECLLGKNHRIASYNNSSYNLEDNNPNKKRNRCALLMTNREKLTPLHCCALFDVSPQLTRLVMRHPLAKRATSMTNSFGATPLHLAAAQPGVATSVATVVAIGTAEAAAVQDRLKRTPLHVASQNIHATSILIKSLTQLYPEASSEKTQRGHLPLHLAAQSQAKEPVMRALLKANPKAAEAKNKSSNTPLHDATKYRASTDVVKLLTDAYPEAVYVQNQYGNLPLHCATAYQAPTDVVTFLLQAWPDGASMQNRNQDAPLHYAAAYAKHVDDVKALIQAAPAAVLLLNSSGQSPIDRARANNAPSAVISYLESSAKEWTDKAAQDGWGTFGNNDNNESTHNIDIMGGSGNKDDGFDHMPSSDNY